MKTTSKNNLFAAFANETYEVKSSQYENRFELVQGSVTVFNKKELLAIRSCVIRKVVSDKYTKKDGSAKETLKLHITFEQNGKTFALPWFKLDGTSVKRYADKVNFEVSPADLKFYQKHDPKEEYGSAENNYSWWEVRILKGAKFEEPASNGIIE